MDATQAIIFSDEEDSEQEQGSGEKKAVAFLHVLAQKELSAVKHPIYEGDNYIGRHDSNSIHMPFKALSKQHACIEVQGNSHLIYDMESRNKTRRGKMFLKPNVRYELRDDDVIIFGDVKCQYILQSEQREDDDDTGSDTDSELMLQPPDSEDLDQDDYKSKEDENDNESSFSINNFLQPTQPCIKNGAVDVMATQAVDNMETQAIDNMATLAVDSPETQAVEGMETQAVDNMATLAVDSPEPQDIDGMENQAVDNMATLAVNSPEPQDIDGMETQAVDNMATLAVDNLETQAVDGMETQAVDNMATLAVDNLETQAVDGMETQAVDNMATLAVDYQATQAVDGMETQAVDNMATLAVDNLETQAIDYGTHSDSSDTDIDDDDVRQSILEAPTQAVALNDSRQQGTPIKECTRTLVLDSSADSSDIDDSPVKQARNVYDDPTQICDSIVSDSGSETDIEDPSMIPETQADVTGASEIDEMAAVAIDQDDEILKDRSEDRTDSSEGDGLNVPQLHSSDDNTELDNDMGNTSQEYFLNYRTNETPGDETPSNPADVEVPSRPADIEATQPYQGHSDDDNTEDTPSKPGDIEPTQPYQGHPDGDSADETPSRPDDIEATQPYQGHSDDEGSEETTPTDQDKVNVTSLDATQRYGDINKDEPTEEPTPASSVTMEMPSSVTMVIPSTQADDAKEKQPDSRDDDETDPTVPYHTEDDVDMETGDSEIECTQAYGMQGGNTQVPDSQDADDEPTSSRFPVFKTQSPSRSCLKQPNTPDRKATKARRVMFQSTEDEESSQETDGDTEPLKRSVRFRGQAKGSKSLGVDEEQSTSKGSRRSSSRVSQRKEDEEVKEAQNVVSGRKGRRSKAVEEAAMKSGQKRKADALEQSSASSTMVNKAESNAERGKKQGRRKVEEGMKEDTVDGVLTVTDAKPTRKKEFDEENPRPSSGKESKVNDKRKLSDSSISSVGSEGSKAGRALKTIVQIGKKLTRGSKRGKKSVGGGESTNDSLPVVTKTLQNTAEVVDDGDSDDTASISSTASSIRDFDEVKPSARPTRGTRSRRSKVADEPDSQSSSGIRRSQRGGTEKEITPPEESKKKVGGRAKKGVAAETVVTEVDGPSTQSSSRTRRSERSTQGDELSSQDDSQKGVSTRGKKGITNEEEVKSKRTRRGAMQEAKPDTQETNPKGNENIKAVELKSEIGKTSKRGKTKAQSSGESEQNVSADASMREDKESQETGSKRKRNATSESQEGSPKDTTEVNVRQSGRRRTLPARFVDSEVKGKDGGKKAASEHEVEDEADAGVFAVPKAVGRPSRKTQKGEPSPSSQGEVQSETVQTSSRGRRSTAKVTEEVAEEERSEQPVKENTRGSRKRGQEVFATKSAVDSKAEETMATPKQRRGLAAAVKTSEGPSKVEISEDLKEDAKESRRRGRQKPAEDAAASEKSVVTPTSRRGQTAVAALQAKTSKDAERDEQSKEAKSTEVAKSRGKRGATSLTPSPTSSPSSAAKRSRQTAVSSPSISPARRSTQRRGENKPKVMFTGVMDDSWQKAVTTLGGELGNSVDDCTHLVTDKVRRTVKFLCSMARGIAIVKPTWLEASMKAKAFVDPSPYQLKDKAAERQYSFSLNTSLDKAKEAKLFDGYKLHVTPGVKPDPQQMKDIIKCAGGEYVARLPTKPIPQLVLVSCDGDKSLWAGPRKAGIPVVSSEFILTGILRQAILLDDYRLK